MLSHQYLTALCFFIFAGVTDALDGLLARLFGWTSRFGAVADPLADKLLLMSSFITLYYLAIIPAWLMEIIVARDIWIIIVSIISLRVTGRLDITPSAISKINTFFQIMLVPVVLVDLSLLPMPDWFLNGFMYLVLLTTVASFIHYTYIWGRRYLQIKLATNKKKKIEVQKEFV